MPMVARWPCQSCLMADCKAVARGVVLNLFWRHLCSAAHPAAEYTPFLRRVPLIRPRFSMPGLILLSPLLPELDSSGAAWPRSTGAG